MVGAVLDITRMKKAEEEIRNSLMEKRALNEIMYSILKTLPVNIALLDANGTIIEENEAWRNA